VGNLPFRRLCKGLGCEVTCGEMALATNLLQGQASEWALLKRHPSEGVFGVQVCGGYPDAVARACQVIAERAEVDFVDLNVGCPIDVICKRQAGSALLTRPRRLQEVVQAASAVLGDVPLIVKMRCGCFFGGRVGRMRVCV
jgi:tRNA-dihydrouridine synthase 3